MAFASELKKVTVIESADTILLEKVRWSLRQRLRKQMSKLSSDLFDEVDDFLFSSGQKGQFADDCIYLKSMRELRAKQSLFEESFLDTVMDRIKASYRDNQFEDLSASTDAGAGDPVFERVEIDLALQAMRRKGSKIFGPFMKQIDSTQQKLIDSPEKQVIGSDVLLDATVQGFEAAHSVFTLPLEIRLVFFKLFEQHFVLKMEKLYLDIISIINRVNDNNFIEKLYSSSSAFRTRITPRNKENSQLQKKRSTVAQRGAQKAELVEAAVSQLISSLCAQTALPLFIEKMVRTKWRAVMFLIGLNRGSDSVEWSEAKHSISMLVAAAQNPLQLATVDRDAIFRQLRQGFSLAQMGRNEQEEFLIELEKFFETGEVDDSTQLLAPESDKPASGKTVEAYINPAGEDILDRDDMDDLAKLLGGEPRESNDNIDRRQLTEYAEEIDQLGEKVLVEFMINGNFEPCTLTKNPSNPELYNLRDRSSRYSVSRSRLGLAVALQNGELRIPEFNVTRASSQNTRLHTSNVRH